MSQNNNRFFWKGGLDTLPEAAEKFLHQNADSRIFSFQGDMGAGKTTFISAICKTLGVEEDAVSSPTFSIVNEYRGKGNRPIYHFDFYRIKQPEEALDFGVMEYFDSDALCFMEWADNIAPLLPEETVLVTITESPDGQRIIEC